MSMPEIEPPVQYSLAVKRNNSTISLKNKLSTALSSCRICLSAVFEPACLINCGHKFCEQCLNTYWHVNNEPELIVCPLCRGQASDIAFVLKDNLSSTTDLRKRFDVVEKANAIQKTSLCFKVMLIPAIYCIINWLKAPLLQLVIFFREAMVKLD